MGFDIISTGAYAPDNIVDNKYFEEFLDTSNEWILERTGIERRHFTKDEDTSDLALKAAINAIEKGNIDKDNIKLVVVATFTGEYLTPSVACLVQKKLNLNENIMAFDINAACSGFVYGMKVVDSLLSTMGEEDVALLIGSEVISKVLNFKDRNTCILFGDGAGAAILKKNNSKSGFYYLGARGDEESLACPSVNLKDKDPTVIMNGQEVFKFAVSTLTSSIKNLLDQSGLTVDDIGMFICHQANKRILASVSRKLKIPEEKIYKNLQDFGNTSAASIPLALNEVNDKGLMKRGDKVIFAGFGAGLTWGSVLIEW